MTDDLNRFWADREKAVLVVVDVQQRLVPSMNQDIYRQTRLNNTVPELAEACQSKLIEKASFGCCGEPAFPDYIKSLDRPQVIVTGMEAHVCVYQTVLGLLEAGYQVHLVRDGICSRGKVDYQSALDNAARAGAVVTTAETVLFQLLRTAAAPEFKAISALIKKRAASREAVEDAVRYE